MPDKRYIRPPDSLLDSIYAQLSQPERPPSASYYFATHQVSDTIIHLRAIESSNSELRHKRKSGACWAYFSTCAIVQTLDRGCCDSCSNQRRISKP